MKEKITIITPVYNDWNCLEYLIKDLHSTLADKVDTMNLIVVNDCSSELPGKALQLPQSISYSQIDLLANVGHQRAIIIGLCYCLDHQLDSDFFIIMDSDGEDNPKYIIEFLDKSHSLERNTILFAKRSKRSESYVFRFFYALYKIIFKWLTGSSISFGNFSCLPKSYLPQICNEPNFWNHYSASVIKSKLPYLLLPTERSKRYSGSSKMNFDNLILHGLSSLSVYIESIIIRVLKLSFAIVVLLGLIIGYVILVKYFTGFAIPGWATNVFGFVTIMVSMVLLFNLLIILSQLNNRNKPLAKPLDFYKNYINSMQA